MKLLNIFIKLISVICFILLIIIPVTPHVIDMMITGGLFAAVVLVSIALCIPGAIGNSFFHRRFSL